MGEFTKPKVTIDLEEYNTLLERSSSIDPYKKLLEAIFNTIRNQVGVSSTKPIINLQDLIDVAKNANLNIDLVSSTGKIEIRNIEYVN